MQKLIKKLQTSIASLWQLAKKRWKISVPSAIALLIITTIIVAGGGANDAEILLVEKRTVTDTVQIAGRVEADIVADLGFEASGTVREVSVKTNDQVKKGDRLVALDLGTLSAELASAQADALIARAQLQNTQINVQSIEAKQDTLVASAYAALLSDGLISEPNNETQTQTAPIITGRYKGTEGTYKIIIERGIQSNSLIRTFGVETSGPVEISKTGPTRIGTRGLYISFPDAIETYNDTIWYVTLPNTKSSSYIANLNAYEEALRARDEALDEANESIRSQEAGVSIAEAELAKALAEVSRIQALIGQRILRAPFDGTVTAVTVDPGESVSIGDKAVSLISQGVLGIKIDLPEVDSVKVVTGNKATIVLDAFGKDVVFTGTVVSVDRSETIVDGVASYEARVIFDTQDERIVSGMTADVAITTNSKDDVIAIPARAVKYTEDGEPYVFIMVNDKKTEQRPVALGLRGSDSFVEILAGLREGDRISIPAPSK